VARNLAIAPATTRSRNLRNRVWFAYGDSSEQVGTSARFVVGSCGSVGRLREVDAGLAEAGASVEAFAALVRKQGGTNLTDWQEKARTGASVEWKRIAEGSGRDQGAVQAALTEPWSNGPVAGHINRLKIIKRQIYGRAGFPFLRTRALHDGGEELQPLQQRQSPTGDSPNLPNNHFLTAIDTRELGKSLAVALGTGIASMLQPPPCHQSRPMAASSFRMYGKFHSLSTPSLLPE
jgi:hypothetical protein